jgi:phosphatidate cytidylyltransferase
MKRVITAILLAIAATYLIFGAPSWMFLIAATAIGVIGYREYSGLVQGHGIPRPGVFGLLAGLVVLLAPPQHHLPLLGLSLLTVLALATALRYDNLRDVLPQVAAAFLGGLYTFAPWRFAGLLRNESHYWLFFALSICWVGDTAAFYVGRSFGKHPMAPLVSPKKSWEGAIGSVVGSVIYGVAFMRYFVPAVPSWQIALIAVAGNIAGQFGDLAESAMKRGAGVKDSGTILPGHGGLLDRIDAGLFSLPIVYLCVALQKDLLF